MPVKRQYNVKGTNDFLILAAIFFFLCIWAVKDAWFPSEKVLKKHPLEVAVAFEAEGTVKGVNVAVGDSVVENQVLAELRSDRITVEYDKVQDAYTESKLERARLDNELKNLTESGASADDAAALQARLNELQEEMDGLLVTAKELRLKLDSSELKSPSKGNVIEVRIHPHSMVEAGQVAVVIDPKDHFYLFNKSLTVLSFILFWVFLAIHILGR